MFAHKNVQKTQINAEEKTKEQYKFNKECRCAFKTQQFAQTF